MATDVTYAKQVQVTDRTNQALERVVAELKRLRIGRSQITRERLVNASWLWLETMDAADLEAALWPHLVRYEALRVGKPDPVLPAAGEAKLRPGYGPRRPKPSNGEADHSQSSPGKC